MFTPVMETIHSGWNWWYLTDTYIIINSADWIHFSWNETTLDLCCCFQISNTISGVGSSANLTIWHLSCWLCKSFMYKENQRWGWGWGDDKTRIRRGARYLIKQHLLTTAVTSLLQSLSADSVRPVLFTTIWMSVILNGGSSKLKRFLA